MRGLDTRIMLAQARIAAVIAGNDADDADVERFIDAFYLARAQGSHDAQVGIIEPPPLFQGEPDLLAWWKDGHDSFAELIEMHECSSCNDDTGNPCHIHG
jgi:hypothetical protein